MRRTHLHMLQPHGVGADGEGQLYAVAGGGGQVGGGQAQKVRSVRPA